MDTFYEKLYHYKVRNKLTNTDLGKLIHKKGDTFRAAVAAESLSILEIEKLTSIINKEDTKSIDEIINDKIAAKLEPILNQLNDLDETDKTLRRDIFNMSKQLNKIEIKKIAEKKSTG